MKNYKIIVFILFFVLPALLIAQSKNQNAVTANNEPRLSHLTGRANPITEFTVVDPTIINDDDYYIKFHYDAGLKYSVKKIQTGLEVASGIQGNPAYFGGMYLNLINHPIGLKNQSINSTPNQDEWGWNLTNGTRRFTWVNADPNRMFNLEAFGTSENTGGAIGYTSPRAIWGTDHLMIVAPHELKKIEIRLATVNFTDDYNPPINPDDPNVSFGYRYLRRAGDPPAEQSFSQFINNPSADGYPLQTFGKNVPLSVWDVTDPSNQRRLAVGFLENNVVGGLVDGKYWPKNYINTNSNVDATSPREWLFIFDEDYSEQYDSRFETELITSDMRIMYTAIWNRRGIIGYSTDYSGQDRIQFIPNIPLTDNDSYIVTPNECSMDLNVSAGWNLLSLPFQDKNMNIVSNIFTNNTSPAYNYRSGFSNSVNLWPATGFFIRNQISETISFNGNLFGISTWLNGGWNLVGPSKWALDVTKIETYPHNVIATPFYQFNNGYQVATTLQPGKGYWVKANSYCDLSLLPVPFLPKSNSILESYDLSNFAGISIIDSKNSVAKLYLADSETGDQYELPPIPPSGIFDVRFSSNKSAENISGSWKTILINSAQYPLMINSGKNILIRDYTGVEIKLIAGEQFKITNPNIERLQIKDVEIPVEYTLMQNYPNPFNPTTTIKFGIPEKTNVQLEIYSLIGERLAEPINTVLEAGYHEINWDASHLASGIYIYKLITNRFSNAKKMIFIK